MKKIILGVLGLAAIVQSKSFLRYTNEECPHDLQVMCADDINKAYPTCEKAAKEHGKDFPADIECMKYLLNVQKDCWPCICLVAEVNHWHVKGCDKKDISQ